MGTRAELLALRGRHESAIRGFSAAAEVVKRFGLEPLGGEARNRLIRSIWDLLRAAFGNGVQTMTAEQVCELRRKVTYAIRIAAKHGEEQFADHMRKMLEQLR